MKRSLTTLSMVFILALNLFAVRVPAIIFGNPINITKNQDGFASFDIPYTYCQNSIPPALPSVNKDGIAGKWSPDTIMTYIPGTFEYIFTADQNSDANDTILISVYPIFVPEFDPIGPFCMSETTPVLPLADKNGITGTWNPSIISTSVAGTINYTFTPESVIECAEPLTLEISVHEHPDPFVEAIQPDCNIRLGSIVVTSPTGGLEFSLDGSAFAAYPAGGFTDLAAGTYVLTTRNSNLCAVSVPIEIMTAPDIPDVPVLVDVPADCDEATCSFFVVSPVGTEYVYSIDGSTWQTSRKFINLAPATYTLWVRNMEGCEKSANITLDPAPTTPAEPVLSLTSPTCDMPIGGITIISPTGAGLEYSIDGTNWQTDPLFENLVPGDYTVWARNSAACVSSSNVNIDPVPDTPATPVAEITHPNCTITTGTLIVIGPLGTYLDYSIDDTNWQSDPVFTGLAAGTYTLWVRNETGCKSSDTFVINPSTGISLADVVVSHVLCYGESNGFITLTATTGPNPVFSWTGPNGFTAATEDISGLGAGMYSLNITDDNLCVKDTVIEIRQPDAALNAIWLHTNVTRHYAHDGTITLVIIGGTPGYNVTWTGPGGFTSNIQNLTGLAAGDYTVTITDLIGCVIFLAPITITQPDGIATLPEPAPMILCPTAHLTIPIQTYQEYITVIGAGTTDCPEGFDESTFKLVSESSDGLRCPETIVRTYQIKDKCGMTATVEHVIIKNDNLRPNFNFPNFFEVDNQDEVITFPVFKSLDEFINAGGFAFDNCAIDPATFRFAGDSPLEGTECDGMIRRRYTVEDYCGNRATAEVQFRIYSEAPPSLQCPPDASIECFSDEPAITDIQVMFDSGYLESNPDIDLNSLTHSDFVNRTSEEIYILRTYTINNKCGIESFCTQRINVRDNEPPKVVTRNIAVYLDETGQYPVQQEDIIESVSDNCSSVISIEILGVPTTIDCNDVGKSFQVEISATDEIGNKSVPVYANITVSDQIPPEALCKDITVYLDEDGRASITPADIDNGSTDNCEIESMTLDRTNFDCNSVGPNTVKLTVVDASGNQDFCTAIVTVKDTLPPVAICRTIDVQIGPNDRSILSPTMIDGGSYDNCGVGMLTVKIEFLTCDNIGETIVTLEVTDRFANKSTCQTTVFVPGNQRPIANDDSVKVLKNEYTLIQVLHNDKDFDGRIDPTTLWIMSPPSHGALTVDSAGGVTYKPFDNYVGADTFSYRVCDNGLPCGEECDTATVFIEVIDDIQAPLIQGDLFDLHFECRSDVPVGFASLHDLALSGITVTDNLAIDSTSFRLNEMAIHNNCIITIIRQYSVSDMAQNTSTIEHTISVQDTQDPTLKCPPNMILSLDHPVPGKFTTLESFVTQGGSVADNCEIDPGSFYNMSESIDTLSNSILIRRAYYVEDFCRNGDICLHQIEIETETNSFDLHEANAFHVSVYPNPSNGEFSVNIDVIQSSSVQLEIIDINGKSVFSDTHQCAPGTNMKEISLKNITPGTYMLKVKSGGNLVVEKVVVR